MLRGGSLPPRVLTRGGEGLGVGGSGACTELRFSAPFALSQALLARSDYESEAPAEMPPPPTPNPSPPRKERGGGESAACTARLHSPADSCDQRRCIHRITIGPCRPRARRHLRPSECQPLRVDPGLHAWRRGGTRRARGRARLDPRRRRARRAARPRPRRRRRSRRDPLPPGSHRGAGGGLPGRVRDLLGVRAGRVET